MKALIEIAAGGTVQTTDIKSPKLIIFSEKGSMELIRTNAGNLVEYMNR